MDSPDPQPTILANRILKQFTDHLLGDLELEAKDFLLMRVIFRKLGGSWESAYLGDIKQLKLLEKIVVKWGANRKKQQGDNA